MQGSNVAFFGVGSSLLLAFSRERRHDECCSSGLVERGRFLALELLPEVLDEAESLAMASGALAPIAGKTLAA